MVSGGLADEFIGVDWNDQRLSKRLLRIVERFGKYCQASIPAAVDGRAEMEAVYRFVDNDKVSPQKLTSRHRQATIERIVQCDVALLVQDTTELDVTRPSQQVRGAGPLSHDSRRGSLYHPLVAFDADGLALGTVWNKHGVREAIHTTRTAAEKRADNLRKPIEEKESYRWLEGVRAAVDVTRASPMSKCEPLVSRFDRQRIARNSRH